MNRRRGAAGVVTLLICTVMLMTVSACARDDEITRWTGVVTRLLAARSEALASGDEDRWRATTASSGSIDDRELSAFASLRALGVTSLTLQRVISIVPGSAGEATAVLEIGYAVPAVDRGQRTARRTVVLTGGLATPVIRSWLAPSDPLEVFDLVGMAVTQTSAGLLVTPSDPTAVPATGEVTWPDILGSARQRVATAWSDPQPTLVVVPRNLADFARLVKRSTAVGAETIAAVTEGARSAGSVALTDRLIMNPVVAQSLTSEGIKVVLAHELTHVYLRRTSAQELPTWFSEGLAEWTAYQDVPVPLASRWAAAIERQRTEPTWPQTLPNEADFRTDSPEFALSYVIAELTVTELASRTSIHGMFDQLMPTGGTTAITTEVVLAAAGTSEAALMGRVRDRMLSVARDSSP